jgi:hypothetical protein
LARLDRLSGRRAISGLPGWWAISGLPGWWTISRLTGAIAWVSRIMRGWTVDWPVHGVGWAVVRWVIAPVAAVSWVVVVRHRSWAVPVAGWTIAAVPAAPWAVVIVDAVASPTPSPATPTPGLVARNQGSDSDTGSEGDEGRGHNGARTWRSVDHGRVVLRHIDYLRIRRLNDIDGLACDLLHLNLLLLIAAQRSCGIGLGAQTLDGSSYFRLIGCHSLPNGGVVVDVVRHHLEHGREGDQSDEGRIEPLLLGGIGERGAGEVRVLRKPVGDVQNLLGVGGSRCDLGQERVGIECDRGEELIELLRSGRRRQRCGLIRRRGSGLGL